MVRKDTIILLIIKGGGILEYKISKLKKGRVV